MDAWLRESVCGRKAAFWFSLFALQTAECQDVLHTDTKQNLYATYCT